MNDILRDMTLERDRMELALGDTLDVKAGLLLAVIAVLGTLSGIFLSSNNLGNRWQLAQFVSILFLSVSCGLAVLTVIPRTYQLPEVPRKYREWADKVELDADVTAG